MRKHTWTWLLAGVFALLALAACSNPSFVPTGSYTGTAYGVGAPPAPISAVITAISGSSWSWSLTTLSGVFTGTCTHDTSVSSADLTCAYSGLGFTGSFVGDLQSNTWSGTFSDNSPESGTFTLTR